MNNTRTKNKRPLSSSKHRAVCNNDSFKGPWRSTIDEAYNDARQHRSKPTNVDHLIDIVTQQSSVTRFSK